MKERLQTHIQQLHKAVESNLCDLPNADEEQLRKIIAYYEKILALLLGLEEESV
jgi:hypothetical protein